MQTSEMLMEMGLEMCVTTVPASTTRTRLTQTMTLWEMHVTATLTGMGELVDIQRDEFGREVRVNVNVNVRTCQCFTKPRKCTGELRYSATRVLNFDTVWNRMVACLTCFAYAEMPLMFAGW